MLRALKETGINARLTQSTYEAYKDETSAIAKNWETSLEKELPSDLRVGITKHIPTAVNQKLYSNIVFDHRACDFEERVDRSDADKEAYKTIAIGGSIPCAMATVRKYFSTRISIKFTFYKYWQETESILLFSIYPLPCPSKDVIFRIPNLA